MKSYKYESNSDKDTLNLGKTIASFLQNKDIIILSGELGAGKTKFTEGILSYFNLQDEISSPTFIIKLLIFSSTLLKLLHLLSSSPTIF